MSFPAFSTQSLFPIAAPHFDIVRRIVEWQMRHDLRSSFRRVIWRGDGLPSLPDGPVIAYANHHHFFDGHLCWLLLTERLGRPSTIWMAEWDRFPFFAAVGAQPFPPDDAARRAATVRRTARRFRDAPQTVLVYFPEGELLAPDGGVRPLPEAALARFGRLYADATWWPLAIHVTWRGDARPTAVLAGGRPHDAPSETDSASAHERLDRLWHDLRADCASEEPLHDAPASHVLLDGRRSASEVWSFSFATSFFRRYL